MKRIETAAIPENGEHVAMKRFETRVIIAIDAMRDRGKIHRIGNQLAIAREFLLSRRNVEPNGVIDGF